MNWWAKENQPALALLHFAGVEYPVLLDLEVIHIWKNKAPADRKRGLGDRGNDHDEGQRWNPGRGADPGRLLHPASSQQKTVKQNRQNIEKRI